MTRPDPLSEKALQRLARHARRTWVYFIAFWVAAVSAVLAIEFLDLSGGSVASIMAILAGGVVVAVYLQFSERCPSCQANLGWQVRLGIPDKCRRCGVGLKRDAGP